MRHADESVVAGRAGTRPADGIDHTGHDALRYAAFDLDGTALDERGRPVAGLEAGLRRLRSRGVRPLLITGRAPVSFRRTADEHASLAAFDDPVLLSHGNALMDRVAGTVTVRRALPGGVPDRLVRAGVPDLVVETADRLVAHTRRAALAYALAYGLPRSMVPLDPDLVLAAAHPALTVTVFGAGGEIARHLAGIRHDLSRVTAFGGYVVRPEDTCKATALAEHLVAHYGDPDGLSATAAFGDAHNDACLLHSAVWGVAVQGADAIAVRHCDVHLAGPLGDHLAAFDPSPGGRPSRGIRRPAGGPPCRGAHDERPEPACGERNGPASDRPERPLRPREANRPKGTET